MAERQCAYCKWYTPESEGVGRCSVTLPSWLPANLDKRTVSDQDGCDIGVCGRTFPARFHPKEPAR